MQFNNLIHCMHYVGLWVVRIGYGFEKELCGEVKPLVQDSDAFHVPELCWCR